MNGMPRPLARRMAGLSLIELMIALALGLVVSGAAIGVFLANQQTYRSTESVGRIQESARVAFELMARDVREGAGNACSRNLPVANVLENQGQWWNQWQNGLLGYENGALPASASGTDAIEVVSASSGGAPVAEMTASSAQFKVAHAHDFENNDILVVCDYTQAAVFQATNVNAANVTIVHNTGAGTIGNCTKALGLPMPASCPGGQPGSSAEVYKIYGPGSQVVKLRASRWYVADNGRGGRSLYRVRMAQGADQPAEEITDGVDDLQLEYLVDGQSSYVAAAAGLDWSRVVAVRLRLTLAGAERVGTDGQPLVRELEHVVNLRNRTA